MKVTFHLHLNTQFGQQVRIFGEDAGFGKKGIAMIFVQPNVWKAEVNIKAKETHYFYAIEHKDHENKEEEWQKRSLKIGAITQKELAVHDYWTHAGLPEVNFSTQFFENLSATPIQRKPTWKGKDLVFQLNANVFDENLSICVLGNIPELGNWNTAKAVPMKHTAFAQWQLALKLSDPTQKIEYKFGVWDLKNERFLRFEEGSNRVLHWNGMENALRIVNDTNFSNSPFNNWRGTGLAIPVFALRSENGLGVGEFLDLKPLADWCSLVGIKMIQILPINDTTATHSWTDSYPYAGVSIYALHPQFLNIEAVSGKKPKGFQKEYDALRKELNAMDLVDYEKTNLAKWKYIRAIFDLNKKEILGNGDFAEFVAAQAEWLKPYAAFCVLRDENKTADFSKWKKHGKYSKKVVTNIFKENSETYEIAMLHCYVQWELHKQLLEAAEYIHTKNLTLKGDIPIGIYRHSADSWTERDLFHHDQQAGAPPDDFAVLGQNWEFPTYNWPEMQKNGYQWWKNRFQHMSQYFDAFRIDHILGFFRIWQIPKQHTQGILGYFSPALHYTPEELKEKGLWYDYKRYTQPFINAQVLWDYFGEQIHQIFPTYFVEKEGAIVLQEKWNTQRKVEEGFDGDEDLKGKLLALNANFLFLNSGTEEKPELHPRYGLESTDSFKHLDEFAKHQLRAIYKDYYFHRNEQFWKEKAYEKLPELKKSTNMLICGEDLGLVPKVVPEVMHNLSILALQIQRMPSGDARFSHPDFAPYLSVVSPSSHDTSTLRQWWEEDHANAQYYFNNMLSRQGEAPKVLTPDLMNAILEQHLWSPAMLCVIPLQEFLGLDAELRHPNKDLERINEPAVFPHYWRYRMHISVEELLQKKDFNATLLDKMQRSGRV